MYPSNLTALMLYQISFKYLQNILEFLVSKYNALGRLAQVILVW